MTHDSRRYHRIRPPRFARAYGMLGALGSGIESAAGTVGSGLESAATAAGPALGKLASTALGGAGKTALGGLESVGQGLQSLFTSGGGEAGRLAALGQAVPEGVDLVGPSPTFTGPGFLSSVYHGFIGGPEQVANPSAATSLGTGVGQLLSTLDQLNASRQGGMSLQPIVQGITGGVQRPKLTDTAPPPMQPGPIMGMLGQLFKGF
jgi:hypothetical protein